MGFFKKLFKKKKGGSFFGNLIRKASSVATGGVFGSGAGLARSDAKLEAAEQNTAMQNEIQRQATALAEKLGKKAKPLFNKAVNSDAAKDVEKAFTKAWFKKNAIKIGGGILGLVILVGGIIWLTKGKKSNKGWKPKNG